MESKDTNNYVRFKSTSQSTHDVEKDPGRIRMKKLCPGTWTVLSGYYLEKNQSRQIAAPQSHWWQFTMPQCDHWSSRNTTAVTTKCTTWDGHRWRHAGVLGIGTGTATSCSPPAVLAQGGSAVPGSVPVRASCNGDRTSISQGRWVTKEIA